MSRSESTTTQSTKPQSPMKQKAKSRKRAADESGAGPKKQRQKKAAEVRISPFKKFLIRYSKVSIDSMIYIISFQSKTMKKAPIAGKSGPKSQEGGAVSDKTNSILITVTKWSIHWYYYFVFTFLPQDCSVVISFFLEYPHESNQKSIMLKNKFSLWMSGSFIS